MKGKQVKSFRPVPSFFALPLLAITLVFAATVPLATGQTPNPSLQVKPGPRAPTQPGSSPEASSIRSRRAAPASPEPAESPATSTPAEATLVPEKIAAPISEMVALRDEIQAATNEPARARLQLKLVDHFVAAGLKQQAIAALKAMSEQVRFDPQGFYNIANAQARLGESEGAIKTYRKAIEQRQGRYSRAENNLGVMLLRTGQWDEAYEVFMSALRQENFRYAEASFNLGRLYSARGENDLAVREWRRSVAVDPKHEAAARALSNTRHAGNIAIAARVLRSNPSLPARRTAEPPDSARSKSNVAASRPARLGASNPGSAGSSPLPAYTIDAETYAFLLRGRTARERGRNEEAADNFRQVLARMGGYFPPANLELSYVLISMKRFDEAIATLLPITVRDGRDIPISHYHLARLYEARGELKLAEEHYSRALDVYGDTNSQFFLDIGRVREKQGNLAGALTSLEQYVASMERHGHKPDWSDERLTALRQKLAASQPKP
jgi:tetratricopeptide (TPR) repeat protein